MSFVVEQDEFLYPVPVGLFSSEAVMFSADSGAKLMHKLWLIQGNSLDSVSLPRKEEVFV